MMDLEIIMAGISKTLLCVSLAFQIKYARKHRNTLPFISVLMLGILTLGHMIPVVVTFEVCLFSKKVSFISKGIFPVVYGFE